MKKSWDGWVRDYSIQYDGAVTVVGISLTTVQCFKTAVELSPSEGHSKYMYLGQLSSGEEAVGYLTTGIEIMAAVLQRAEQNKQTEVHWTTF